jgi:hypothetical protein
MRFTPWYPLAEAEQRAPAARGMLQLRLAAGLVDYPRGKSAMVHYAVADDVRVEAVRFATGHHGPQLWCRHLDTEGAVVDVTLFFDRVMREFERRFGAPPALPGSSVPLSPDST